MAIDVCLQINSIKGESSDDEYRALPKAKIQFMRTDGHGQRIKYWDMSANRIA